LQQYLARIEDPRLKRIFAAAFDADQPAVAPVHKPFKRADDLWKGLSSRHSHSPMRRAVPEHRPVRESCGLAPGGGACLPRRPGQRRYRLEYRRSVFSS